MVTKEEKELVMAQIRDILEGTSYPDIVISSGEIAKKVGIKPGKSNVTIRYLIRDTITHYKLPVEGTSKGYVMITEEDQLLGYLESLEGRIQEIEKRKAEITEYFYHNFPLETPATKSEKTNDWGIAEVFGAIE